jgi:heme exporter protein B
MINNKILISILHIKTLVKKEISLEWRNRYAFNGLLLYLAGVVFVCYLSFNVKKGIIHPITWNAILWIIMLFNAINAVSKSFSMERESRYKYYYTLFSAESLIVAKIIYNILLMSILNIIGLLFYTIVMGNPVQDFWLFVFIIILSAISFASVLTLVAAIASKAGNNPTLMAILSFPILLPIILFCIKTSKNAIDGLELDASLDEIVVLTAINAIVLSISYILFPFLWRD